MLTIDVPAKDFFDEAKQEFISAPATRLTFEHSLVSLSKWESRWEVSFLGTKNKTDEQVQSYLHDMCITENVDPLVFAAMTEDHYKQINTYLSAAMTATTVPEVSNSGKSETVTSELIYYWMIAMNIPFECQTWHLNRLLMLIKVCNIKNTPPDKRGKMGKAEMAQKRRELNAQRRAQLGTRG